MFLLVPVGIFLGRYFQLSLFSYFSITLFVLLHLAGSHYTYAETPFGFTLGHWFGTERNMYDRLVHFSFGLLFAFPIREMFFKVARVRGVWGYIFPLDITLSVSALFEIIEWAVVRFSGGAQSGVEFLATQGDVWDATLDMASAAAGAVLTLLCIGIFNWIYSKPFREEMRESLKIQKDTYKSSTEVKLKEVLREKRRKRKEKKRLRKAHKTRKVR